MRNLLTLNSIGPKGSEQTKLINEALVVKGYPELQLERYTSKNGNQFYGSKLVERSKYPTDTPSGIVYQETALVLNIIPKQKSNKVIIGLESKCPIMQSEYLKYSRAVETGMNNLKSVNDSGGEVVWKVDINSAYGQANKPFMVLDVEVDDIEQLVDIATDMFIETVKTLKSKNVGSNLTLEFDSLEMFYYKY